MTAISKGATLVGLAVGLCGALSLLTLPMLALEEEAGLAWLFQLRGSIEGPSEVAIISIDSESATKLDLPLEPRYWPRVLHAEIVRQLHAAGASVVAFDLSFQNREDRQNPEGQADDAALADAMREAGNVILLERIEMSSGEGAPFPGQFEVEQRLLPSAILAAAALGTAPFPLPVSPAKTSQFWVFGRVDPDVPTLPSAALHAYALAAHDDLLDLLEQVRKGSAAELPRVADFSAESNLTSAGQRIRKLFRSDRDLASDLLARTEALWAEDSIAMPERRRRLLERLIELYGGPGERYINFYGPARSIQTIPYHQALSMDRATARSNFDGKAVFVGFSELRSNLQEDDFLTVFSDPDGSGTELGGVEIGATAFANLLDGRSVQPVAHWLQLAIALVWGTTLAIALIWLPTRFSVALALVAAPLYVYGALRLFAGSAIWLPLITPVFLQTPLAVTGALIWNFTLARRQGDRVRRVLATYLPKRAIDELSKRIEGVAPSAQLLHGTCLVTDAQNYTGLAERLRPQELQKALNAYYGVLFPEIERRGGFIADVVGDSMVAIWATPDPDAAARLNACRAAVAIQHSTGTFNSANADIQLPTRIGIHSGEILLGDVGTASHLEYRAIGDIVNTASRIQELNKRLRTTLLVSEDVLQDTGLASFRRLGEFLLAGKGVPVRLCDHIGLAEAVNSEQSDLIARFEQGHELFRARRWRDAAAVFESLLARNPGDGPSEFFRGLCERFQAQDPGADWTGAVRVAAG